MKNILYIKLQEKRQTFSLITALFVKNARTIGKWTKAMTKTAQSKMSRTSVVLITSYCHNTANTLTRTSCGLARDGQNCFGDSIGFDLPVKDARRRQLFTFEWNCVQGKGGVDGLDTVLGEPGSDLRFDTQMVLAAKDLEVPVVAPVVVPRVGNQPVLDAVLDAEPEDADGVASEELAVDVLVHTYKTVTNKKVGWVSWVRLWDNQTIWRNSPDL